MGNWEDNIRKVTPYVPGEQPKRQNIIKLNTNENPYPPAPGVVRALKELDTDLLRRYPDPSAALLVDAIAENYGLKPEQVFVGVGSDDVLAMAFLTCFNSDKPILFPDITYSFYDVWAELFRIPYEVIPLDKDFRLVSSDYKRENGGIIFPNPNAPTGEFKPLDEIEEILNCNQDVIVIVDEAYIDFGGDSALPLLKDYDNLLIAQTFSKSRSMAGMRIGYLLGNEKLIRYVNDCKYSFNSYTMNQTAIVMGVEAVKDKEYFLNCREKIMDTREWAKEEFRELGFCFGDSMSNFLFVSHPLYEAQELFEALRDAGIYVRHFKKPERIKNYLRITIGTREEMERLFEFLKQYQKKQ
ncbi:MAG: histidinol-phosphate transaminase [Lachnospiraceae bacterium]|nr:histidinol-phosphate transaminase [Lachnospiraceae bacterium]